MLPDDGFDEAARAFALALAEGPTRAHAATKTLVRAQVAGGARAADELVPEVAGGLFATEDLNNAVRTFLEQGPGTRDLRGPLTRQEASAADRRPCAAGATSS